MSNVTVCFSMASVARFMRNVQLVSYSEQKVMIGGLCDHRCIEVFLRNWKMGSSWITNDGNSESFWSRTEFLLISVTFGWSAENSIAVLIQNFLSSFSSRIKVSVKFVAISPSPMISSKIGDIAKSIVVKIKGWQMFISKLILENVDQPIPRSRLTVNLNLLCQHLHFCLDNSAIWVAAKS